MPISRNTPEPVSCLIPVNLPQKSSPQMVVVGLRIDLPLSASECTRLRAKESKVNGSRFKVSTLWVGCNFFRKRQQTLRCEVGCDKRKALGHKPIAAAVC